MKLKLKLTTRLADEITAKVIKEAYYENDSQHCRGVGKADCIEIERSCRVLYHYFTGKTLK